MLRVKFFIFTLIFTSLIACSKDYQTNTWYCTVKDDYSLEEDYEIEAIHEIENNVYLLSNKFEPFYILISINDKKIHTLQKFGYKGYGPEEFVSPYFDEFILDTLYVVDTVANSKLNKYFYNKKDKEFLFSTSAKLNRVNRVYRKGDNIIYSRYAHLGETEKLVNQKGELILAKSNFSDDTWINEIKNDCYLSFGDSTIFVFLPLAGELKTINNNYEISRTLFLPDVLNEEIEFGVSRTDNNSYDMKKIFDNFLYLNENILLFYDLDDSETKTLLYVFNYSKNQFINKLSISFPCNCLSIDNDGIIGASDEKIIRMKLQED